MTNKQKDGHPVDKKSIVNEVTTRHREITH